MGKTQHPARQESGVVLIVGLIFLSLMTIVGVTAIQNATLQERMASNAGVQSQVFQVAENALRAGERTFDDADCNQIKTMLGKQPDPSDPINWSGVHTNRIENDLVSEFNAGYVLTRIPSRASDDSTPYDNTEKCGGLYYITARAQPKIAPGSTRSMVNGGWAVVLQSTVRK